MNHKNYKKEQLHYRLVQMWYGTKFFSLPHIYKLRNKAYRKLLGAGEGLLVGYNVVCYRTHGCAEGRLIVGNNVHFSNNVTIDFSGEVVIGDNVSIANGSRVFSHKHYPFKILSNGKDVIPVKTVIGDGVKIEAGSIIMPGITIGEGATIVAGSVVWKNVEPYTIVMGNPAKDIRDIVNQKME